MMGVNILILKDLGNLVNLDSAIILWVEAGDKALLSSKVTKVASLLGGFLASLHRTLTLELLRSSRGYVLASSLNDNHDEASYNLSRTQLSELLESDSRCKRYFGRLIDDLGNSALKPRALVHGRFTSQNILFRRPVPSMIITQFSLAGKWQLSSAVASTARFQNF